MITAEILRTARALRVPIPEPARPKPRALKQWNRLKVGQYLISTADLNTGGFVVPAGTTWQVSATLSNGAQLKSGNHSMWQTNPDWLATFVRSKGRPKGGRKKRAKVPSTPGGNTE